MSCQKRMENKPENVCGLSHRNSIHDPASRRRGRIDAHEYVEEEPKSEPDPHCPVHGRCTCEDAANAISIS